MTTRHCQPALASKALQAPPEYMTSSTNGHNLSILCTYPSISVSSSSSILTLCKAILSPLCLVRRAVYHWPGQPLASHFGNGHHCRPISTISVELSSSFSIGTKPGRIIVGILIIWLLSLQARPWTADVIFVTERKPRP